MSIGLLTAHSCPDAVKRFFSAASVDLRDEPFALQLGDETSVQEVFDLELASRGHGGCELF